MGLVIRQALVEEVETLAMIEAACFPPAEAASREVLMERMGAFPENFLVAELDETIVGFINGGTTDKSQLADEFYHDVSLHKPEGAYQTVFGLNVLPDCRRQGIAEKLVNCFLELAKERGKKAVILTCKKHLIHYYERFGFVKYGVSDSCHGGAVWYDMRCYFAKEEVKTGLVLEGGGMRGIYTAGVLDVFLENGITEFDGLMGVSAGAVHGCSYLSGQRGRSLRYYKKYGNDPRFMSFWSLLCTGDLVGTKFCYHDIPDRLDPYDYLEFKKNKTKFYVACTNVETGEAEYLKITDMKRQIDLMRASASMPYVSRIVRYGDKKLLDGGCADSIPVKAFRRMGYKRNVVVLTRPAEYTKTPENAAAAKLIYRKYPRFCEVLKHRHEQYNHTLAYLRKMEKRGLVYVIRPSEDLRIGRMEHDMEKVQQVYEIGRKDALHHLEELKAWLKDV